MRFKLYKFDMSGPENTYWLMTPLREPPTIAMVYAASVVIECVNNEFKYIKNRYGHNDVVVTSSLAKFMRLNHMDRVYFYNGTCDPLRIGRTEPKDVIASLYEVRYDQIHESLNFQHILEEHYEIQMHLRRSWQDRRIAETRNILRNPNSGR